MRSQRYLVKELAELFIIIAECIRDGLMLEHADPLPEFCGYAQRRNIFGLEEYDEDEDILRYEEEEVFPDDLFFSFYYYLTCKCFYLVSHYWMKLMKKRENC